MNQFAADRLATERAVFRPAFLPLQMSGFAEKHMTINKRKAITKKTRFEVFKRDSFACQYCGKAAPDVVLHIDHINPVSKGGKNDLLNLITACEDCNSGKSDRLLDDDSMVAKQRAQLAELAEKKEQLEMMISWRDGIKNIEESQVDIAADAFERAVSGFASVNDKGRSGLKKLIKSYGLNEVLDCIDISADAYFSKDEEGSAALTFKRIGGIAQNRSRDDSHLYYIRGIVRNRMYCNERDCLSLLKDASKKGASESELKDLALTSKNWTNWRDDMCNLIHELESE